MKLLNHGIPMMAAIIAAVLGSSVAAHAEVQVTPGWIKVTSLDDSFAVKLTHADGSAIPAGNISALKVMVNEHDYDHMFDMEAKGDTVVITPTDQLEIGSYTLVLKTAHGNATIKAEAPLSDLPGTIEYRAEELGITPEALRRAMDIADPVDGRVVDIKIPSVYYLGQKVDVAMNVDSTNEYAWSVDGKTVQFGYGDHDFEYTFMDTGYYFITYREFSDGEMVTETSDAVVVVAEPAVAHEARKNQAVEFPAPDGYARYAWHVGGRFVDDGDQFTTTFAETGSYVVECYAHTEAIGPRDDFRKVTYVVDVQ